MSGGGLGQLAAIAGPAALMMIPGVGEALAPMLASGLGMGAGTAGILSPALIGAALSGGTSALTGGRNPLQAALLGGVGSGVGAALTGAGSGAAGIGASDLADANPLATSAGMNIASPAENSALTGAIDSGTTDLASTAIPAASTSPLARVGNYVMAHPLQSAILGNAGLSAVQSMMPHDQVNVGANRNSVMATNPNFSNPNLPAYHMANTAAPYAGNWYTYGMNPQTAMYNAQPTPGYARGGRVHPLAHHMRPTMQQPFSGDGQVSGPGGGQDDSVPARLSQDEFVMPADVVSHLGDGSSNEGGKKLTKLIHNVRKQKATKGFPPKSKNPLSYMRA